MVWKKTMMTWTTGSPRGLAHLRASLIFFPKFITNTEAPKNFVRLTYENSGLNFKIFLEKF